MSQSAQSTVTASADAPSHLVEALRRLRYIEECGRRLERDARTDGNEELVAEMQRRAADTQRLRSRALLAIHQHRRAHAPARNQALPRPRIRARRTRTAAQRAGGTRAGTDPGGGDDDPHDDAGGPGTFASFHRATPGLTGAQRLRVFESLPEELREIYWENLARSAERGR